MNETSAVGQIHWCLPELMAQRNQMSQAEMARALEADGAHVISRTQVGRMATRSPTNVSLALIGSLCRILECSPNELLGWQSPPTAKDLNPVMTGIAEQGRLALGPNPVPPLPELPAEAPRLDELTRARVVGPPARALPAHAVSSKPK